MARQSVGVVALWLLLLFLWSAALVAEIGAREAIRPAADEDVGQLIKDLEGLQVGERIERGPPCSLDVQKDLPRPDQVQPLYLRPQSADFWLPNAQGKLQVPRGASIELHCTKSFANVSAESDEDADDTEELILKVAPRTRTILARCLHGSTFEWLGKHGGKQQLRNFVCAQALKYSVERLPQSCGGGGGGGAQLYRVGYNVSAARFVATMELCHDATQLRTHYTKHRLSPASVHFQRQVRRSEFSQAGHFLGYDLRALYSQRQQTQRLAQLLGGVAAAAEALAEAKTASFLSRGHLAAKADFIYASQQRSSFNYLNAAPQWQSFNGGQWQAVEDETRKFVARRNLSVSVYTGNWGVMPLPAAHGPVDFYLAADANNNGVLAVPRLFYRVLVDDALPSRGIALLGVNNPLATLPQILEEYVICEPVQESVDWLRWMLPKPGKGHGQLKRGYLYACAVSDLASAVGHLPPQLAAVHELLA